MISADLSGRILALANGKIMAACLCCDADPPDCVHMTLENGVDVDLAADLARDGMEWRFAQLVSYPRMSFYWKWTCNPSSGGVWDCGFSFQLAEGMPLNNYGFVGLEGMVVQNWCAGPPKHTWEVFGYTVTVSACLPGTIAIPRPHKRERCSHCRGL